MYIYIYICLGSPRASQRSSCPPGLAVRVQSQNDNQRELKSVLIGNENRFPENEPENAILTPAICPGGIPRGVTRYVHVYESMYASMNLSLYLYTYVCIYIYMCIGSPRASLRSSCPPGGIPRGGHHLCTYL